MTPKDARIAKFWDEGCSVSRIAKKIGNPKNEERVIEGLVRTKRITEDAARLLRQEKES